jgi:hypothetical protein
MGLMILRRRVLKFFAIPVLWSMCQFFLGNGRKKTAPVERGGKFIMFIQLSPD